MLKEFLITNKKMKKSIFKRAAIPVLLSCMIVQGIFALDIEIKGRVLQASDLSALEFANVVLQTSDSVFVTGTITDLKGDFVFKNVSSGDYRLIISLIGYETQSIELQGDNRNIDLKEILLEESSVSLGEVTVTASSQINRIDKKLIFPTEQQIKASTNGIDLLMQLALPKVTVNPMEMAASLAGSGELQYRINGVKVEQQDILSLQPAEIIRVEYHDNPGLRYGNAEVVLDYIVRRPETGGNGGIMSQVGLSKPFLNNNMFGRINHKKSEFAVSYFTPYRDFKSMWRDNEEKFVLEDGTVLTRKEEGEPGQLYYWNHNINTMYSYQNDQRMFNASFRYFGRSSQLMEFNGTLYNMSNPEDRVKMTDNSDSEIHRPAFDLYYQENMKNGQTFVMNLVGTYNYTDNRRFYDESRDGISLTHVDNRVIGKRYSFIGEGIYEKTLGNANRISAGIRHSQSYSDNVYKNGFDYTTEMNQGETFLYAEFKGKVRNLDYMLGVGATRSWFGQANNGDDGYSDYTFNPRFSLQYTLPGQSSIRLRSEVSNISPSLSELSAIDQTVDSLQIQRGNPLLKPYLRYFTQLTYNYRKGIVMLNAEGSFEYCPNAIMDEKFAEGTKIVQTWNNQKNFQQWNGLLTMRIGPVKNIFQFSLRGGVRHFISNGNSYKHTYTNWYTISDVTAMYKNAMVGVGIETNRDFFIGETMNGGENIHFVMAGYTYKNANLTLMMLNPFVDNYRVISENRSQYASYERKMYINDSSRFMALRFTWNFSFGRTFNAAQKLLNNVDEDSGVMQTGK